MGGTALLPLGILTSLFSKLAYEIRTLSAHDDEYTHDRLFHKPLFMTLVSFVAMAMCLVPLVWRKFRRSVRGKSRVGGRENPDSHVSGDDRNLNRENLSSPLSGRTESHTDLSTDGDDLLTQESDHEGHVVHDTGMPHETSPMDGNGNENSGRRIRRLRRKNPVSLKKLLRLTLLLTPVACTDVIATILTSHAILRLPLSTFLTLRHFQLVFASVIALIINPSSLNALHKLAVALSISGAALVVLSTLISETNQHGRSQLVTGFVCLLLSQISQAITLTFETTVALAAGRGVRGRVAERRGRRATSQNNSPVSPMAMLGLEGLLGVLFLSGVVMPVAQVLERGDGCGDTWRNEWLTRTANSISENTTDTFQQLAENKNLAALLACYCIGLVLYNVTGAQVANVMGVMSRTKLEVVRTGLCWLVAATIRCGGGAACFPGESGVPVSLVLMKLSGFVMGTLATLLYGRGDAAWRQKVFERDVHAKREYRGRGRRRVGDGGDGGVNANDSTFDLSFSGAEDEEALLIHENQGINAGGFGSPVTAHLSNDAEDCLPLEKEKAAHSFGSGSLKAHSGFLSFGVGVGVGVGVGIGASGSGSRSGSATQETKPDTASRDDEPRSTLSGFDDTREGDEV